MRIGVIGSGNIGATVACLFIDAGHGVAARDALSALAQSP